MVTERKPIAPIAPNEIFTKRKEIDGYSVAGLIEICKEWGVDTSSVFVDLDSYYCSFDQESPIVNIVCSGIPNKDFPVLQEKYLADMKIYRKAVRAYNKQQKENKLNKKRKLYESLKREFEEAD
jgi:hypothetical protein